MKVNERSKWRKNIVWKITKSCISDQAFHIRWQLMHELIILNKDILMCIFWYVHVSKKRYGIRNMDDKCTLKNYKLIALTVKWKYAKENLYQTRYCNKQDCHIFLFRCRSNIFVHRVEDNPTYNIRKLVWDFVLCIYCKIWRINIKSVCLFWF